MDIITERFTITDMSIEMCNDVHKNSLDEDNRSFLPDEVYETLEEAQAAVAYVINAYQDQNGPFVYAIISKANINLGYVQVCKIEEGWEIGYHIAADYTENGYERKQ